MLILDYIIAQPRNQTKTKKTKENKLSIRMRNPSKYF